MGGRDNTAARRGARRDLRARLWLKVLEAARDGNEDCRRTVLWALSRIEERETTLATETASEIIDVNEWRLPSHGTTEHSQQLEVPSGDAVSRRVTANESETSGLFDLTPPPQKPSRFRICGSELEFAKEIKARFNDAFGAKVNAPPTDAQSRAIFKFKRKYGEAATRIAPWVQKMTRTVSGAEWKASLTNLYSLAVVNGHEHPYWEWLEMRHETHREPSPAVTELMKKWGDLEVYRERFPRRELA